MELVWLDDLIALAESESLSAAADRRNCSQSAFSRRIQTIEAWLGTPVLDRSSRPIRLKQSLVERIPELQAIAGQIRDFRGRLRTGGEGRGRIGIASQHSLTAGALPRLIAALHSESEPFVSRVRSANRGARYAMLMTRHVDLLIVFENEHAPLGLGETAIEKLRIGGMSFFRLPRRPSRRRSRPGRETGSCP